MSASTNVKVGITVTVFLTAFAALSLWVSQYRPGKESYTIEGRFDNVGGLIPGSKVHFLGVKVGTVDTIIPDLTQVRVLMSIDAEIKIPKNTSLLISSSGFVGDKAVDFLVDRSEKATDFYQSGDVIEGTPPVGMSDLIQEGQLVMKDVRKMLNDPELNKSIRETTKNVEMFTKSLNSFVSDMDTAREDLKRVASSTDRVIKSTEGLLNDLRMITGDNRQNINQIILSAKELTNNLNQVSANVNDLLEDPNTTRDVKMTLNHIRRATDAVEHISKQASLLIDNANNISSDIQSFTGDEKVTGDIKDFIKNTNLISQTFANTLSTSPLKKDDKGDGKDPYHRDRFSAEFKNEFLGSLRYKLNANTEPVFGMVGNINILAHTGVFSAVELIKVGLDEIGENNLLNLQLGFYPFNNLRTSFGLVRGKLGLGATYLIPDSGTELLLEAYDIATPQFRIGILQNVYQDYGVSLYWNNRMSDNNNQLNLGLRWQPGIF